MKPENLSDMQLDALREVGSIGAGHAATALSQLVDRPVALEVPTIEVLDITEVPRVFGGPEQLVLGVYSRMLGAVTGSVLFMIPRDAALTLIDLLHGRPVGTATEFGVDEEALLGNAASVLVSSYLAAIARLTSLDILPSGVALAYDMAGALIEAVVAEAGMHADAAVLVRTTFLDESCRVEGALFFLPDSGGMATILSRLGMA